MRFSGTRCEGPPTARCGYRRGERIGLVAAIKIASPTLLLSGVRCVQPESCRDDDGVLRAPDDLSVAQPDLTCVKPCLQTFCPVRTTERWLLPAARSSPLNRTSTPPHYWPGQQHAGVYRTRNGRHRGRCQAANPGNADATPRIW